jgi:5-methylcytosine-specific restriction enzyme subunit McrC
LRYRRARRSLEVMSLSGRVLKLKEWIPQEVELGPEELDALQRAPIPVNVSPSGPGRYVLTPGSVVGAATSAELRIIVQPKLAIERVFFLVGYSRGFDLPAVGADLAAEPDLVEVFAIIYLNILQKSLRRGLLLGYVRRDEAEPAVRGRVRFGDQARRRYGLPLPVEVSYDDYTADTEPNQLIKASLRRLSVLHLRSTGLRRRLAEMLAVFDAVSDTRFDRRSLPTFSYNRLNERYRQPLELARLIVQNTSPELRAGDVSTIALTFDMNVVFEDFIFAAMGDSLSAFGEPAERWCHGRSVALDEATLLEPEPDLSLWRGGRCVFVGDAKYKVTGKGAIDDLYQLLAYCTATDLREGLLIYAEQPAGPMTHRVVHGGPQLHVEAVNVEAPTEMLLARCRELAGRVLNIAAASERELAAA